MSGMEPPTLDEIEVTLDALLRAAIEDDAKRPSRPPVVFSAADLGGGPIPTRLESDVRSLVTQPVGRACRQAIRRIGEHLFVTLGSTEPMAELVERVAAKDRKRYSHRISIIDHAWDGLGGGNDRWLC